MRFRLPGGWPRTTRTARKLPERTVRQMASGLQDSDVPALWRHRIRIVHTQQRVHRSAYE